MLPLNPCHSLSEQSEDDIDALAFGKQQQPESIANPLYEASTPAPPEPSCDPFTVSSHFTLSQGSSGVQNAAFWQRPVELHHGKSTPLECLRQQAEKPLSSSECPSFGVHGKSPKPGVASPPPDGGRGGVLLAELSLQKVVPLAMPSSPLLGRATSCLHSCLCLRRPLTGDAQI